MKTSLISKRFEFKYHLNPIKAEQIEKFLLKTQVLEADYNSKSGAYHVNSLYFDTPQMTDYRDKDGSFLIRKKLRARMYQSAWSNDIEKVWLEVKHKHNMNIKKTRGVITGTTWNNFFETNNTLTLSNWSPEQSERDREAVKEFVYYHKLQNYKPVAVVRYKRKAYLADFTSPVRITFDFDIQTGSIQDAKLGRNLTPVSHQGVVMEVKFNDRLPWWFSEVLNRFNISRTDFSKYRNSLAIMRGVQRIPINK